MCGAAAVVVVVVVVVVVRVRLPFSLLVPVQVLAQNTPFDVRLAARKQMLVTYSIFVLPPLV